jgi:hypothetical protein
VPRSIDSFLLTLEHLEMSIFLPGSSWILACMEDGALDWAI